MRIWILGTMVVLAGLISACEKSASPKPAERPVIQMVDDVELAKLILKPESEFLDVSRDPFKPLEFDAVPRAQQTVDDFSKRFKILGVTMVDNEFRALLLSSSGRGVYRVGDKIEGYEVQKITLDQVTLTNGVQTVILKRGESK